LSFGNKSSAGLRCLRDIFFMKAKISDNGDKCQYKIINRP